MRYIGMILVIMLLFAFGCTSAMIEGKKFDASKVSTLALDQPKDQVVAAFGQPLKTENLPSGVTKFIYHYYYKNPHWWTYDEEDRQDLEVLFKDNRVESFKYKGNGENDVTL